MTDKTEPIIHAAAAAFGISVDDLLAEGRVTLSAYARFAAVLIMKRRIPYITGEKLAYAVGRTHHTSAIYALKKANAMILCDPDFASAVKTAEELLDNYNR